MTTTLLTAPASGPALVFRPVPPGAVTPDAAPRGSAAVASATTASAATTAGSERPAARLDAAVYRRRRLAAVAVLLGIVLTVVVFGRQAGAERPADQVAAESVTVTVQPGDTLWSIARSLAPGEDPRPLTDALVELAGGTSLQPGQRIVVPGALLG